MTIFKALQKIDTLTKEELNHCIQRMDIEIDHHKICIKNYPPNRMERCGIPYLKRLEERRKKFLDRINQL